ncbi:hypothetical protein BDBG_08434 [Blastomyces gilchristii SLH14081]|uniref:AT hook domain-containing protein n=1 Tax=Blastomyces gilchristii (strain SLH14081) TaxID=559298 RepID=A0A179V3K0_BLAGS|nr:uncharacterized protein BDBG_08434 [Blastomyces gilchristii SLH14081]OAT13182.1 hypothetical protein BDBG_08434 [Blastomyces gilchristii SLH14081]
MSNPPDIWKDDEKVELLTEILKQAKIPPVYLYTMIQDHGIRPAFMEIPLPPGRSLMACQNAYNHMAQEYSHMFPPRQSPFGSSAPLQISPGDRKRPLHPLQTDKPPTGHRAIQPKPTPPGRYPSTDILKPHQLPPSVDNSSFNERPRKRGRPSKLETQRRNQLEAQRRNQAAAQARGEMYPVKGDSPRFGVPLAPSLPTGTVSEAPPFATMRPQVTDGHVHATQIQPTDALGSQTQDIRVHRAPRPPTDPSAGTSVGSTPNSGPGELTARTIIESQAPPPTTSSAPSFRGINQSSSVPENPKPETTPPSNTTTAERGGDISPPFSRARRESAS